MERSEEIRVSNFFEAVRQQFAPEKADVSALVVTHLLYDRPLFLRALAKVVHIRAVLPKPKSIDPRALGVVEAEFAVVRADRAQLADPEWVRALVADDGEAPLVLADIGGYFAPVLEPLRETHRVIGVVEDTENGLQKYQRCVPEPDVPILSVARSPLKEAEDYLVGHSIVFSTEALIRSRGDILQGRPACVIGYGKVGRSIAHLLRAHGVMTSVFDTDSVRLTEAMAHGFRTTESLGDALRGAGLVMCATGNFALRARDFQRVASGAYIASVTSSDDELELEPLRHHYRRAEIEDDVVRYRTDGHYFFVLNRGNAVNFLHGAVVGPAIYLVQAEILASVARLCTGAVESGYSELSYSERQLIATAWLEQFGEFV